MKDFTLYPEAFALRELGFDEPCFMQHDKNGLVENVFGRFRNSYFNLADQVSAPTYSQAFRFFREKYGLYHIIHCPTKDVSVFTITGFDIPSVYSDVELKSYEEAELACLRKLIEIVKNK